MVLGAWGGGRGGYINDGGRGVDGVGVSHSLVMGLAPASCWSLMSQSMRSTTLRMLSPSNPLGLSMAALILGYSAAWMAFRDCTDVW